MELHVFALASSVVWTTHFGVSVQKPGNKDGDGNQLLAGAEHRLPRRPGTAFPNAQCWHNPAQVLLGEHDLPPAALGQPRQVPSTMRGLRRCRGAQEAELHTSTPPATPRPARPAARMCCKRGTPRAGTLGEDGTASAAPHRAARARLKQGANQPRPARHRDAPGASPPL